MRRKGRHALDGIPIEIRPASPATANPLNPFDRLSPEERHRCLIETYVRAWNLMKREESESAVPPPQSPPQPSG